MDPKETAKIVLDELMSKAIDNGAKPSPVLESLAQSQDQIRASYWQGDIAMAITIARGIGTVAEEERKGIDSKWCRIFQSGEYNKNPLEDPEYMQDFVNMRVLDKWFEAYGRNGEHIRLMQGFLDSIERGERRYAGPSLN